MEKECKLFDKRFVHFMWANELKGKRGFLSSGIDTLIKMVNEDSDRTEIQKGCERDLPFCKHITVECRLAYYDPNYEVKKAYYKEGKKVQVGDYIGNWADCHGEPHWSDNCKYRIKPECPCEEGIDSKACAGCPQDEWRKQTFRPFKDCDELVEFWSKNYQTGFRPANTKPLVNIKKKNCQEIYFITGFDFDTECSRVFVNNEWLTLDELFNNFEFLDRNIIGVLSEE